MKVIKLSACQVPITLAVNLSLCLRYAYARSASSDKSRNCVVEETEWGSIGEELSDFLELSASYLPLLTNFKMLSNINVG